MDLLVDVLDLPAGGRACRFLAGSLEPLVAVVGLLRLEAVDLKAVRSGSIFLFESARSRSEVNAGTSPFIPLGSKK